LVSVCLCKVTKVEEKIESSLSSTSVTNQVNPISITLLPYLQ